MELEITERQAAILESLVERESERVRRCGCGADPDQVDKYNERIEDLSDLSQMLKCGVR